MKGLRLFVLTGIALLGFAANSLLCREALRARLVDPVTFTTLRLVAGAVALAVLSRMAAPGGGRSAGNFLSATALFVYALAFSIAYVGLGAGVGALVLFGSVQLTMVGWGCIRGERPRLREWLGLALAGGGLVGLTFPGLHAPNLIAVALMAAAGVAWGVYSLRGRRAAAPLLATAGNFARTIPLALGASALALLKIDFHVSMRGALLAVTSGAVTSGLCYTLWYTALRELTAARAAIVQLLVPVLAALGGILLLGEAPTVRLVVAGSVILGGVALAVVGGAGRR